MFDKPVDSPQNILLIETLGLMCLAGSQKWQQAHRGARTIRLVIAWTWATAPFAGSGVLDAPVAVSALMAGQPIERRSHGSLRLLGAARTEHGLAHSGSTAAKTFARAAGADIFSEPGAGIDAAGAFNQRPKTTAGDI